MMVTTKHKECQKKKNRKIMNWALKVFQKLKLHYTIKSYYSYLINDKVLKTSIRCNLYLTSDSFRVLSRGVWNCRPTGSGLVTPLIMKYI